MRYDIDSDKIIISCREFVTMARRGIAASMPADSDEPELHTASKRILKKIMGDTSPEYISYSFDKDEFSFLLSARAEKADGCNLWFTTEVDSNPSRPKKECTTQLRGEGFVFAYVYAKQKGLYRVKLNFVFINSETDSHFETEESVGIDKLEKFFNKCLLSVKIYAAPEVERVRFRLPSMKSLKFPYKLVRKGQGEFVRSVYKSIARGGTLFATAPTGTGKTISVLYPALRAMGEGKSDKIFYFTPKETTANSAIECLALLSEYGASIRAIKLTAKEKCCKRGLLCRESRDRCSYARCNRLADSALSLYNEKRTVVTIDDIYRVSEKYCVCPYELSLTYSELCDVVICDFNYLFDPAVYIRRFFTEGGNYTFLIDEAHNLPDRAREIYSAEMDSATLLSPCNEEILGEFFKTKSLSKKASDEFYNLLFPYVNEDIITDAEGKRRAFTHGDEIPVRLYGIFDELVGAVEDELFLSFSAKDEEKEKRVGFLRSYYYKIKKFRNVMQRFDSSYEMFIFYEDGTLKIKLFCIDTGHEISERLKKGRAAVFFSATLTPLYYYKSLLGGDGASEVLEIDSPFSKDQLLVAIMDKVSTRYSERDRTLPAVCRVIAATVSAKRGNYIIFSPSFAYSEALAREFSLKYPKIKVLSQRRDMSKQEKDAFLAEFSKEDDSYLIGFCVMGGIYSEGIDLAGDSLIGAIIVGIGLPGLSVEREAISAYYNDKYDEGKQFAYIYPGMNRVLQAAGRVIRREDDRGVIVLIDDRFDDPIYKKIIPSLWNGMRYIDSPKLLRENLDDFWKTDK